MLLPVGSMRVNSTRLKPKTILMYRTWVNSDGNNIGILTIQNRAKSILLYNLYFGI